MLTRELADPGCGGGVFLLIFTDFIVVILHGASGQGGTCGSCGSCWAPVVEASPSPAVSRAYVLRVITGLLLSSLKTPHGTPPPQHQASRRVTGFSSSSVLHLHLPSRGPSQLLLCLPKQESC